MKKVLFTIVCIASAALLFGQEATVSYLEGSPEIRRVNGTVDWLDFGMTANPGENISTGTEDFVELDQAGEATIRIQPDSIFTIREAEINGQQETVLSAAAGSVSYRFGRIAGREPRVGTTTTVAGIRGTELTVYAAADGSAMFLVDSGLVEVSSAGETVELTADEGVEVSAGGVPGEKFERLGREIDFTSWNVGKVEDFLADPIPVLDGLAVELSEYSANADEWFEAYLGSQEETEAARETLAAMTDDTKKDAFRNGTLFPLMDRTSTTILNYRYHALSATSLRRYSLGTLYMEMKTRNIIDPSPEYDEFLAHYHALIDEFHDMFDQYLNENDF